MKNGWGVALSVLAWFEFIVCCIFEYHVATTRYSFDITSFGVIFGSSLLTFLVLNGLAQVIFLLSDNRDYLREISEKLNK